LKLIIIIAQERNTTVGEIRFEETLNSNQKMRTTMRTTLAIGLLSLIFLSSCKKVSCDATLCVKNIGTQTIHYGWGTNMIIDSILPGQSACKDVGHIETGLFNSSTSNVSFDSDHGDYIIEVDECEEHFEVE